MTATKYTPKTYSAEFLEQDVDMDNLTDEQFDAIFGEALAQVERGEGRDAETVFNELLAKCDEDIRIFEAKKLKKIA